MPEVWTVLPVLQVKRHSTPEVTILRTATVCIPSIPTCLWGILFLYTIVIRLHI